MIRIPGSTYRLQLHKGFKFDDAAAIADYLKALGITHVYSSPYLQAAPGSMHGYDVVDHQKVNEELGGVEAHERFCKKLGEADLGQVLDLPYTSEWFSVPPAAPHGQSPKLGTLHPSMVRAVEAAFRAAGE